MACCSSTKTEQLVSKRAETVKAFDAGAKAFLNSPWCLTPKAPVPRSFTVCSQPLGAPVLHCGFVLWRTCSLRAARSHFLIWGSCLKINSSDAAPAVNDYTPQQRMDETSVHAYQFVRKPSHASAGRYAGGSSHLFPSRLTHDWANQFTELRIYFSQ